MNRHTIDIMLDIETLGKQDNTAIFQIYMEAFNRDDFKTIDSVEVKIDIRKIDPALIEMDTLYWWTQNHGELFKQLTEVSEDGLSHCTEFIAAHTIYHFLKDLKGKCENLYLWGNGSVFDNIKIKNFLQRNGYDYPIFYKSDQDLRTTLRDASRVSGKTEEEIKKLAEFEGAVDHNARDDVKFQINILKRCDEILLGKELFAFDTEEK